MTDRSLDVCFIWNALLAALGVFRSGGAQARDLFWRQRVRLAELPRYERDLRELLHGFHLAVGGIEVAGIRDDAVVGHENRNVVAYERLQCLGERGSPRGAIPRQGHA